MVDITEKEDKYAIVTVEFGAHMHRNETLPDWDKEYTLHEALERMHELNKSYGNKDHINELGYRCKREAIVIHHDKWKNIEDPRMDTVTYLKGDGEADG